MNKKVYFENSRNDKLCGILSDLTSNQNNPMIILCHGLSTSKDSNTNIRLERIFNSHNISTFRFDFYGHGESDGKFEDVTLSEAADDVISAIKYLSHSRYGTLSLVGSSFGGMVTILAASETKNLKSVALKCPVSDHIGKLIAEYSKKSIYEWKQNGFIEYINGDGKNYKLNYTFFEDANKINVYETAKKIKIPTLIVHGDKDDIVPLEQSEKLASLIDTSKIEIIKGGDHVFSDPKHFEEMIKLISDFIIKNSQWS